MNEKQLNRIINLRKEFLDLLSRRFGEYSIGNGFEAVSFGEYLIENGSINVPFQKSVAVMLGYSEPHMTNLLKEPSIRNNKQVKEEGYINAIKRVQGLFEYEKFFQKILSVQHPKLLGKPDEALEKIKAKPEKSKGINLIAAILGLALAILAFYIGKEIGKSPTQQTQDYTEPVRIDTVRLDGFVISDKETFDKVRNYHLEFVVDRLLYDIANTNILFSDPDLKMDSITIMNDLVSALKSSLIKTRKLLESIGFTNEKGINIVSMVDTLYPRDSLFSKNDKIFLQQVKNLQVLIRKPNYDLSGLKAKVKNSLESVSDDQWAEVWKIYFQ
jgi:hypothetical protein